MPTPILDAEIIKLRRRLGDVYDENGNAIVNDTSPGAGEVYLGDAALDSTWTRDELLDCYNDAVRMFLDYVTTMVDKGMWSNFIPGYIRFETKSSTTVSFTGIAYDYVALGNLVPPMFKIISVRDPLITDRARSVGVEVPASEFFDNHSEFLKTRRDQLFYCIMQVSNEANPPHMVIINKGGTNFHLIYIKTHIDLVHDSATDLAGITPEGLKRVLLLAEKIAQRYRSVEERTLAESDLTLMMGVDSAKRSE